MGVFHRATITPTKAELIAQWAPSQPWGPSAEAPIEVIGAFRFDDPENRVGMETHLISTEGRLLQVPLTYRDQLLSGAEEALIGEMHHSELGTRWVYDGLGDERFIIMLAAVTMTGQGEALGMAVYDERWHIAPTNVRIRGGGWTLERVPVDGFRRVSDDATIIGFQNDRFQMSFHRQPMSGPPPTIGLTATWDGQPDPIILAEVQEL